MQLALGLTLLIGGAVLFLAARREASAVPLWMSRLAIAIASLGVSTLAFAQEGLWWSVSSICFSLIAIVLIISVLLELVRRS